MNRGDRREPILEDDADRQRFVEKQSEARAPSLFAEQRGNFSPDFFAHAD